MDKLYIIDKSHNLVYNYIKSTYFIGRGGFMALDIKQEVINLTNKIIEVTSAQKIYLFGSFAYGEPGNDSDIDLCIVTNDNHIRKRDLVKSIRKSIAKVATVPVDILVYDEEEFSKRAKLCSTIEYKIVNEGVSIYEQ